MFDFPPEAFDRTTEWELGTQSGLGGSIPGLGVNTAIWYFRNHTNGYRARFLVAGMDFGLRFGGGVKGVSDVLVMLASSSASAAIEWTLRSQYQITSAFSAADLVMAHIDRITQGATVGAGVANESCWLRTRNRDRTLLRIEGTQVSFGSAEFNAWSLGGGRVYFPF